MANVFLIDNAKNAFNIGGVCYWNHSYDGQVTFKRKLPPFQQSKPII